MNIIHWTCLDCRAGYRRIPCLICIARKILMANHMMEGARARAEWATARRLTPEELSTFTKLMRGDLRGRILRLIK